MQKSRLRDRKLGKNLTKKKPKRRFPWLFVVLAFLFVFIGIVILIFSRSSVWDGKTKVGVSVQKDNGDVAVLVLDPASTSITTLTIPSETEVQASNQLGTWKIGSITKLGRDKKIKEDFLKNTVIKTFGYPIDEESGVVFLSLISGNPLKRIQTAFTNTSGFSVMDKIKIALFSLQVNEVRRFDIDLSKTSQLERVKLLDGSLGFQVSENIPTNIEAYFAIDNKISGNLNLLINNATSVNRYSLFVGKVFETLGINVTSIQNKDVKDFDCKVTGLSRDIVIKMARIFSCETDFSAPSDNFDIQVDIGTAFKNRF
jgi:hypothetical protein